MENTMHADLTLASSGELCDDLAMLYALEQEESSITTEPFCDTDED